jgi:hypothetical protein
VVWVDGMGKGKGVGLKRTRSKSRKCGGGDGGGGVSNEDGGQCVWVMGVGRRGEAFLLKSSLSFQLSGAGLVLNSASFLSLERLCFRFDKLCHCLFLSALWGRSCSEFCFVLVFLEWLTYCVCLRVPFDKLYEIIYDLTSVGLLFFQI